MYKKIIIDGYILGLCEVSQGGNITEEEYNRLTNVFMSKPEAPEGYYYMLLEDETWELIKKQPEPEPGEEEITDAEAVSILLGGEE